MHKYDVNILRSDQESTYVAAVPDLPGCSALGETYDDALREVQIAMALWIDTTEDFGEPLAAPAPALELLAPPADGF